MPATASPTVFFLFEDEIREAGRALNRLRELRLNAADDSDEVGAALCDAINTCMAALSGAERDDACLLLTSKPALGLTKDAP